MPVLHSIILKYNVQSPGRGHTSHTYKAKATQDLRYNLWLLNIRLGYIHVARASVDEVQVPDRELF